MGDTLRAKEDRGNTHTCSERSSSTKWARICSRIKCTDAGGLGNDRWSSFQHDVSANWYMPRQHNGNRATRQVQYIYSHTMFWNSLICIEGAATDLNLPQEYIKIIPHPHTHNPSIRIIPLSASEEIPAFQPKPDICPWAPFKNLADFEYTKTAIKGLLSKKLVNTQLARINSTWAVGSLLSIKSHKDIEEVLSKARKYFVQVRSCILCCTITIWAEIMALQIE